ERLEPDQLAPHPGWLALATNSASGWNEDRLAAGLCFPGPPSAWAISRQAPRYDPPQHAQHDLRSDPWTGRECSRVPGQHLAAVRPGRGGWLGLPARTPGRAGRHAQAPG